MRNVKTTGSRSPKDWLLLQASRKMAHHKGIWMFRNPESSEMFKGEWRRKNEWMSGIGDISELGGTSEVRKKEMVRGKERKTKTLKPSFSRSVELTGFVMWRHLWAAEAAAAAAAAARPRLGVGAWASPCHRSDWRPPLPCTRRRSGPERAAEQPGFALFFVRTAGSTLRSSLNKAEVFEQALKRSLMA